MDGLQAATAAPEMTEATMALTKSFKELVQRRVADDAAFGEALLREGIDTMLAGDVDTGKAILRDYIKATVRFEKLGEATGTQPKSLIRMFARAGIRRPATSSASSATCRNRPASSSTSGRGQAEWQASPKEKRLPDDQRRQT